MAKKPSVSLETFAKNSRRGKSGVPCWLCSIPERRVVEEGKAKGTTYMLIRDWLVSECGYDPEIVTFHKIKGHFLQGRHHEPSK